MASFRKRGKKWLAEVRRKGVYQAGTFYTKAEAQEWARVTEVEIDTGKKAARSTATLRDAFKRYAIEVTPRHKGERWENIRLKTLKKDPIADVRFKDLTTENLADYRDRRLRKVMPSSVNREISLLSSVISQARKEWNWIETNPVKDLDRPRNPKHRERRISSSEIDRICVALNYEPGKIQTKQNETALAFLLAIETAMRASEITGLLREDVFLEKRYVLLRDSKNHDSRAVSLSLKAIELIKSIPDNGTARLFGITAGSLSTTFRRARKVAKVEGLTFHDSRHEAITRLARKLDVLDLAAMIGHRDLKSLKIYYNPTPTEIAKRLD